MKKTLITISAAAILLSTFMIGCSSPEKKMEDAQENVTEATEDLDKANQEYLADIENFRKETNAKIAENDKTIIDLNLQIKNEKKADKIEIEKKIAVLEQKNIELKKRMDEYQASGKENWETFKAEFNHDMDELGQAFKDLSVKNTK